MKAQTNNFRTVQLHYFMFMKSFGERNYTDAPLVIEEFIREFSLKMDYAKMLHSSYIYMVSGSTNKLPERTLSESDLALVPLQDKLPKAVQEIEREYVHPIKREVLLCGKIVYTYPSRV